MSRFNALFLTLMMMTVFLAGCTEDDTVELPSAYIDNTHIYIDGSFSDETICQDSLVISGGEYYTCTFTLNSDAWLGIELQIASGSPSVDLITMSELNFQSWENGDEYYYLVDITDFKTSGGSYSSNGDVEAGNYVMVISNLQN